VYGGEGVVLDDPLGDDNGVLEVKPLPRHESHEQILTQGQLALVGGGAVGHDRPGFHFIALLDERALVDTGPLVGAGELPQVVFVQLATSSATPDRYPVGDDPLDGASVVRKEHVAGVCRSPELHPRPDVRGLAPEERHGLFLHVGAHERPVGVVVLEERDQSRADGDRLQRSNVYVVDLLGGHGRHVSALPAGQDLGVFGDLARLGVYGGVCLGDRELLLLVGGEVLDLVGELPFLDLPVGRLYETVVVYSRERRQLPDEPDVRALRRLYGTHPAVVGGMHVAHLYRCPLPAQTASPHRGEASPVGEPAQGIGLVHELRELGGAEKLLYGAAHGLDVDHTLGGYGILVLGRHPLAHHALHAVHPDPERLLHQFPYGPQAPVAKVLVLIELVADALEVDRLARPLPPEDLQQGLFPGRGVVPFQSVAHEPRVAEPTLYLLWPAHP